MNHDRYNAACTLFNSPLHQNRPVILVSGGYDQTSAEVFDYTASDHWEESKYIVCVSETQARRNVFKRTGNLLHVLKNHRDILHDLLNKCLKSTGILP